MAEVRLDVGEKKRTKFRAPGKPRPRSPQEPLITETVKPSRTCAPPCSMTKARRLLVWVNFALLAFLIGVLSAHVWGGDTHQVVSFVMVAPSIPMMPVRGVAAYHVCCHTTTAYRCLDPVDTSLSFDGVLSITNNQTIVVPFGAKCNFVWWKK